MITQEQIEIAAIDYKGKKPTGSRSAWAALDFLTGANWALQEAKVAELEAKNERLLTAIKGLIQVIENEDKGGDFFKNLWLNQAREAVEK